jgi:UDP-N-acetylglucosamine transferase subunit ALG13
VTDRSAPVICLAASGGGHLRQILDLHPAWSEYAHYIVTEDTALGRSQSDKYRTEFVPHFALGQARLGRPFRMLCAAWNSLWRSLAIIRQRKPDVVITTGAGSMVFILLWARLFGARVVIIDSFARFRRPSTFARLAGPLAHRRYAQSEESARNWPGALVFDPLKPAGNEMPAKEDLLLATVGATLPFPRLAELVAEAKRSRAIKERVVLQIGKDATPPDPVEGLDVVEELEFDAMLDLLCRAKTVICHGGTGSIITALQNHCHTIVVPRLFERGEHYDDHQAEITESFVHRGLVREAQDMKSLCEALEAVSHAQPIAMTTDYSDLIAELQSYLAGCLR